MCGDCPSLPSSAKLAGAHFAIWILKHTYVMLSNELLTEVNKAYEARPAADGGWLWEKRRFPREVSPAVHAPRQDYPHPPTFVPWPTCTNAAQGSRQGHQCQWTKDLHLQQVQSMTVYVRHSASLPSSGCTFREAERGGSTTCARNVHQTLWMRMQPSDPRPSSGG